MNTNEEELAQSDIQAARANGTREEKNEDENQNETNEKEDKQEGEVKRKEGAREEEGDECPICLEELMIGSMFSRFFCCGKGIHNHCAKDLMSMKMSDNCPLCRAIQPTSYWGSVKQLRPWVKKKKSWAQFDMGGMYERGLGVKQSYEMARMLYEQAAQQGNAFAMNDLGVMYYHGKGVEKSYEKAKEYYEQSVHLGFAVAQYALGYIYANGEGVEVDLKKARDLWTKAAAQVHDKIHVKALHGLKQVDEFEGRTTTTATAASTSSSSSESTSNKKDAIVYCSTCQTPQTESFVLKKCSCRAAQYCNKTCQQKHRKEHKNECRRLTEERKSKKKPKKQTTKTTTEADEGERKEDQEKANATTAPAKHQKQRGR